MYGTVQSEPGGRSIHTSEAKRHDDRLPGTALNDNQETRATNAPLSGSIGDLAAHQDNPSGAEQIASLTAANDELRTQVKELSRHNLEITLLGKMNDFLQ